MSMEMNCCAAKELCICKAAGAPDGRHACPACQCNVHAICGELCEDAGIFYHTTCFPCFAKHKRAFESPDDFQHHLSVIASADRQEVSAPSMAVVTQQVMDGDFEDIIDGGHTPGDPVATRTDKANKRREFIKKLTLSQCVLENVPDGANTTLALVSIAGISVSKLLLSELQLFCASQKISGYRQKKKQEVAQLIAARVTSDNIYASIGRMGMQKANDSSGDLPRKKAPKYQSKTTRPKAVTKNWFVL
ncbi:hypothetical protein MHU86_5885 [Fragilaria crotonensis]|nr:hypothetical protein MHU86_5885 [Fragilaria crotonensis]